tara:strand:+ start:29 stop:1009 length:981 start_codon:yes stop_codon:yes gene_type:complete
MILLTGSTGYIGSHISHIFEKNKIKYVGIDNLSKSSVNNIVNKKRFLKLDYGEENKIIKFLAKNSISSVIHCAAYAYVLEGERKKKIYFNNNVKKSKKFINECIKKKIQNFIFLSSSNVYKESNKKKIENSKIKISHIKNNYGKTKFLIEKFLISKKKNFKNLIILRVFNIAGYTNNLKYVEKKIDKNLRIFPLIFKKIKKKKIISVYVKNKNNHFIYPKRDYLHINDLLNLIIKIIRKLNKLNKKEIYNVGMGINYSLNEILPLISKRLPTNMKKNLRLKFKKIDSKELISTLSDVKKTSKTFNWKPKNSIDDIISSCINNLFKL